MCSVDHIVMHERENNATMINIRMIFCESLQVRSVWLLSILIELINDIGHDRRRPSQFVNSDIILIMCGIFYVMRSSLELMPVFIFYENVIWHMHDANRVIWWNLRFPLREFWVSVLKRKWERYAENHSTIVQQKKSWITISLINVVIVTQTMSTFDLISNVPLLWRTHDILLFHVPFFSFCFIF